jgi:phosphoribosylaminoimidazole-succinocarboxamide synthase
VPLPEGLREGDRLPTPIFTPATKAEQGAHDENITFDRACEIAGGAVMERLRAVSIAVYEAAASYAEPRGLLLADTKFEFGFPEAGGETPDDAILIDEALTPDSSRYWPAEDWRPGRAQPSFDKQYVRDYLLGLVSKGSWDKTAPGPALPEEIVRNTLRRYEEAAERLFGTASGGPGKVQAGKEQDR